MSTRTTANDRGKAKKIVSFQLPVEKLEQLDQRAERQGANRSEIIRSIISDGLEEGSK